MIDGWPEAWEQECMSYLMAREYTTPAEFADHFHLSDQSAAYWLGCMVKCGRVRIAGIERRKVDEPGDPPGESLGGRDVRILPLAFLEVSRAPDTA